MKLVHKSHILLPIFLISSPLASADSYHSVQMALTQQNQLFEFNAGNKTLNLQGYRLGYRYSINNWRFSVDYNRSEDEDTSTRPKYSLSFENSGYSFFAEYNWQNIWLALGYSLSQDKTGFSFKLPNAGEGPVEGGFDLDVYYQNIVLDTGYLHTIGSGLWTLSGSLTRQILEEEKQAYSIQTGSSILQSNTQIDENAWMASMGINYSHYFQISKSWELSLAAGLNHQFTLEGEGQLQQTSIRRTAISTNQNTTTEVITENQSSSTSNQLQVSLLHDRGNINFDVDKLTDQSIDDAYFSIGVGVNF